MKTITSLLLLVLFFSACRTKSISELAEQAAKEYVEATEEHNFEKMVDYCSPLYVEDHGGRNKMIEDVKDMKRMKSKLNLVIGKAKETKTINSTTYVLLSYTVQPADSDFRHFQKFSVDMVGVSKDKGKTWWFIDGPLSNEKFKRYLPDLVGKMIIPSMQLTTPQTK